MQPPMPSITGASTVRDAALCVISFAPLAIVACSTSDAGREKRIAKPHAHGPCFATKSDAKESGCSFTRKLLPPWRYSVTALFLCFATAVKPSRLNKSCNRDGSGAANSTNSKPSTPIGFSNVVGCTPLLGCALMMVSTGEACSITIVSFATICKPRHDMPRHAPIDLEKFVPYQLSIVSNTVSEEIAREYRERFDLGTTEWRVMAVLARYDGEGLSARAVARLTAMDKVAISRALARLVAKGRVLRRTHHGDKRRSVLRLSASGWRIHDVVAPRARQREREFLETLNDEERVWLARILDKLMPTAR